MPHPSRSRLLLDQGVPILFDYDPRKSLQSYPGSSFSRGSVAYQRNASGVLVQAASGAIRDAHYVTDPVTGEAVRTTLLEGQRTNLSARSEPARANLSAVAAVVEDVAESHFGLDHWLRIPPDSGGDENAYQSHGDLSASSGQWRTLSMFIEVLDGLGAPVLTQQNTSASDLVLVMQSTFASGASNIRVETIIAGQLYRAIVKRQLTAVASAQFGLIRYAANRQRDFRFSGWSFEASEFPSSYIKTTGSAVARSADNLSGAFLHAPQEMTGYIDGYELGGLVTGSAMLHALCASGSVASPYLVVQTTDTFWRLFHHNGSAEVSTTLAAAASIGQRFRMLLRLYADGSVQMLQKVANGAESTTTRSAANALAVAWSGSGNTRAHIASAASSFHAFEALRRILWVPGIRDFAFFEARAA